MPPTRPPEEVPVEDVFKMWPEVFDATAQSTLDIAIGFAPKVGSIVTLLRLRGGGVYVLLSDRM